jgi:voltage-gated potassium channel
MLKNQFKKISALPFTHLENDETRHLLRERKISAIIVDILDGDLWGSKVSLIGNLFIIAAIIFTSTDFVFNFNDILTSSYLNVWRWSIGLFFMIEVSLRIFYASFLGFGKGIQAPFRYLFSFMGLVDCLSLIPIIFELVGIPVSGGISAIRILRIWRIARFIKSFNSISKAFHSRREEILVTLFGVLLLSLTLSAIMFHFESENGSGNFKSIPQVFVWSIGKYTGDYGAIAGEIPLTQIGKIIATINGLLGIALFAIPAGLLASAFIDQLAETRKQKIIKERTEKIIFFFTSSKGGGKHLKYPGLWRYASFETLQAKLLLTDDEIFEAVRESQKLRFRAMKSQTNLKFNDIRIVEYIPMNVSYGIRIQEENSKLTMINVGGYEVRGISHFVYTLATNLKANYFAREVEIQKDNKSIGLNRSVYFLPEAMNSWKELPDAFQRYVFDINSTQNDGITIIFAVAASGRGDIIWEFGNSPEIKEWTPDITTIKNNERLESIRKIIAEELLVVNYRTAGGKDVKQSFNFEENTLSINQPDSLLRHLHQNSSRDVFALYVNIRLLIAEDETYYTALTAIGNVTARVGELYGHKK